MKRLCYNYEYNKLVRKDKEVNEHERLHNKDQHQVFFYWCSTFYNYIRLFNNENNLYPKMIVAIVV
jgi:hypothetical protein